MSRVSLSTTRLGRAVLLASLAGLGIWSVTHLQAQWPSSMWIVLALALWLTILVSGAVAVDDALSTKDVRTHIRWPHVAMIVFVGIVLGGILAPPLAALRPLPAPIIERVPIYTADILDTGPSCVYTWNGEVYVWARVHLGIKATTKCPPVAEARAKWHEAQLAPVAVQ